MPTTQWFDANNYGLELRLLSLLHYDEQKCSFRMDLRDYDNSRWHICVRNRGNNVDDSNMGLNNGDGIPTKNSRSMVFPTKSSSMECQN